MAYKEKAPLPVAEGGTGDITLTNHGVLVGAGTSAITQLAAASTGQGLMGNTGADPSFTGSPSFSGSVTAGTSITASLGNITATSGNLVFPATSSSVGKIVQNGVDLIHTFGSDNLFIGTPSGKAGNYTLTGTDNIAIGANVMQNLTSGSLNFGIGTNTLNALTSGQNNVGYGIACLQGVTTTNQNLAIGNNSTRYTTGSNNIGIGYQAYQGAVGTTTGSSNICIGTQAGSAYTAGETNNIIIGSTLAGTASESNITRIGNGQTTAFIAGNVTGSTGLTATTGNVTITSGNLVITANTTSSVGQITQGGTRLMHTYGPSSGLGDQNLYIGSGAGNFTASGGTSANTGVGYISLASLSTSSPQQNAAFGNRSLTALTTGSFNTAIGSYATTQLTTGNRNVCIGNGAGNNYNGAESSNINIGADTGVYGVVGESNVLRIGGGTGTGNGQINKSFIHGIRGITTVNADAIAVLVDSAGQLGTVSSSIRFKENVQDLPDTRVLELRPVQFNFKQDGRMATGLIAEEVEQVMPQLVAYNQEGQLESVKYHDLPVLLLAEIQKLRKELDELKNRSR